MSLILPNQRSLKGILPIPMSYSEERPQVDRNTLFLNRGDGTYAEIAQLSGLDATEWSLLTAAYHRKTDGHDTNQNRDHSHCQSDSSPASISCEVQAVPESIAVGVFGSPVACSGP